MQHVVYSIVVQF